MMDPEMYRMSEEEPTPSQYVEWRRYSMLESEGDESEVVIDAILRILDEQAEKIERLEARLEERDGD